MARKSKPFVDTPLHKRFRTALALVMDEQDVTKSELARATGLSPSAIGQFLNAKAGTSIEALDAMLKALDVTPEYFFEQCDLTRPTDRVQPSNHHHVGPTSPTQRPKTRAQAALDQLKAAFDVATELLADESQPPEPLSTGRPDRTGASTRPRLKK